MVRRRLGVGWKTALVLGASCLVGAVAMGCGSPDVPSGAAASSGSGDATSSANSSGHAASSSSGGTMTSGTGGAGGTASGTGGMGGAVSTSSSAAGTGGAMSSTGGAGGAMSSTTGAGGALSRTTGVGGAMSSTGGAGGALSSATGAGGAGGVAATTATGGQVCAPGVAVPCYSGPEGTQGVGQCQSGTQTCDALGDGFGPCIGEVLPSPETCATPVDDDCNGQTNEGGAGCACVPSSTQSCYSGPPGTLGVGSCVGGIQTCNALGTGYGACVGEVLPKPETCATPGDDDCNGQTNEGGVGCLCVPSSTAGCYSGPAGTQGVGICLAGTKTCNALGTAYGSCVGEVLPQAETCTTPEDDNCNGQTNEGGVGCACAPNTTASCYTGPAGTLGVGTCAAGTKTCNGQGTSYGACVGDVVPQAESCAALGDENCNGQSNEGCACAPNTTASCYTGPAGTAGVGICTAGTKTCNAGGTAYGACAGEVLPTTESCATPGDENCNGQVNEGCACAPNSTSSCYSGPAGTAGVGLCHTGTQTCNAAGTAYGACVGEVTPVAETCNTAGDDNCNGQVNEGGVGCACAPNSTGSCYSGPAGTVGVGICTAGTHTCNAQGTAYGACVGEVDPQTETCTNAVDDNCNGVVNESGTGCVCAPNSATSCYSGPAGTAGVGICTTGTKTCNALGTAYGSCVGEVTPQAETCNTPVDDNCNGQVNEGGAGCVCSPSSTAGCYSGPAGTLGVGICIGGTKTCNAQGTSYGSCVGEVTPQAETCNTPYDDNCNGQTNEGGAGCACAPNSTASCYSGPAGTAGVGLCTAGTKTCNGQGTAYGACAGEVDPQTESCATPGDDNCNGQSNEGCVCVPSSTASCYSGPAGTAGVGICTAGTKTCNAAGTAYGACAGEVLPTTESCATPGDENCNGQVNEGCACAPNSTSSCYSGPAGTAGVGLCHTGTQTCNAAGTAYGACVGEVTPVAETCNTAGDDNCNGQVNEGGVGCACAPNSTGSCYSGPAGTVGVGICTAGTHTCNAQGTAYGACVGEVDPQTETCTNAVDDNCNGVVNESGTGCVCAPNSATSCYSGPAGTAGVGICTTGTKTCNALGTAYGSCVGEVTPQAETCNTPVDDNCNGQVNEGGAGCVCSPSSTAGCYSGPAGTLGVGICIGGTKTCNAQGTSYGSCVGEVTPQAETCNTPYDDNCNGQTNEGGAGCACAPNSTASCYSGPAGTAGVGLCTAGTKTCNGQGTAYGACAGEVDPQTESCATPGDDNCNGQSNEGCVCVPSTTASCYSGPAGTAGVGICTAGTKTCNAAGTAYGACAGEVDPQTETCTNSVDDNCDGVVNESGTGCVCTPSSTASCYSGPAGTQGVGICTAGTKTCNALGTAYGSCAGEVVPQTETCTNSVDDNCNGVVNESGTGCVCTPNSSASCYSGPAGTAGVGICTAGTKTCNGLGTAYGSCVGEVTPQAETCNTPVDDNCNGQTNEGGAGCVCAPSSTASCYSGPAGTAGVGICSAGNKTCNAQGTAYGSCVGEVLPQAETCNNSVDDDCNGQTNEGGAGCVCAPNSVGSCYSGPAGTAGVGICVAGSRTCNGLGTAYGACSGEVLPQTETCLNSVDDNCNGQVNESGAGCVCTPNSTASCYSGPAGTAGVGLCVAGTKTCNATGTAYGACVGEVDPQPLENCSTAGDDDCNGAVCTGPYLFSKEWGSGTDDEGFVVTTDASGNILVGGYFTGTADFGCGPLTAPAAGDAALMLKLGPTGNCLWNKAFGNTAHINGGVFDAAGNIYVTGFFFNTIDLGGGVLTAGSEDVFVAKYNAAGVYQWGKKFGDPSQQESTGLGIDSSGNLYLAGFFAGKVDFGGGNLTSAGNIDVYLAKLTSAGAYVWAKGFGDASAQRPYGTATDSSGNTAITGTYQGTINFGGSTLVCAGLNDGFLARFNSAGTHVWSKGFGDATDQQGNGVAVDNSGNTFASGQFSGTINLGSIPATAVTSLGGYDAYVAKFDVAGNLLWQKEFGGANNQTSLAVAVDWSGSVVISSTLFGSADYGAGLMTSLGNADIVFAKLTSTGGFVWAQQFGDVGTDQARRVWFDPSGNLYATGITTTSLNFGGGPLPWAGGEDIFLVKLGP
ncbi:MAG: MopE-related protein [Byssovorax sp.]